jgi:uncharacterized protein (DUF488 family)
LTDAIGLTVAADKPPVIWTIGHSVRSIEEFLDLLGRHEIEAVADVRSFPGSRRFPQYGQEPLRTTLATHKLDYHWLPDLGGRRRALPNSPNLGWRNASFRGYADHMSTPQFAQGLQDLLAMAAKARTALMCSEALWWRCHRSLISDALSVRGIEVLHIADGKQPAVHPMTAPARIVAGVLTYGLETPEQITLPL